MELGNQESGEPVRHERPSRFGPYTLVSKLGSGGMGVVHLALCPAGRGEPQTPLVVKRLHPFLLDEPHLIEMFLDEGRLATFFDHPNVVRTVEVGEVEGVHFLAMEYLEGRSLLQMLQATRAQRKKVVPPAILCRIVCDILDGLHYAHELVDDSGRPLRIVHRDISPGNVFVTTDGYAKLLDFGVAKAVTQKNQTKVGMLKGKISYVAPEQIVGAPVDRRIDIWSTGVVLIEALTGESPFAGRTDIEVLHKLADLDVDPFIDGLIANRWPAGIVETARLALRRDPDKRYATAQQMRRALRRYLKAVPASHADVARYLRWLFEEELEEERARLGSALSSVGVAPETWRPPPPPSPAPRAEGTKRRRRRRRKDSLWISIAATSFAAAIGIVSAIIVSRRGPSSIEERASESVIEAVGAGEGSSVEPGQPAAGEVTGAERPEFSPEEDQPSTDIDGESSEVVGAGRRDARPSMRPAKRAN